jgi:hypothetical protein
VRENLIVREVLEGEAERRQSAQEGVP